MKKFNLILTVVLLTIIVYAFDKSIETTGTQKEKDFKKNLKQKYIDEALKMYQESVKQKRAKGEAIDKTEEDVVNKAIERFNYRMQKADKMVL